MEHRGQWRWTGHRSGVSLRPMLELASVPALAGLAPSGAGLRCRFPEQQYQENDIGFPKATVLADRLRCAVPGASVDGLVADAVELLAGANLLPQFDLIIDATANRSVAGAGAAALDGS